MKLLSGQQKDNLIPLLASLSLLLVGLMLAWLALGSEFLPVLKRGTLGISCIVSLFVFGGLPAAFLEFKVAFYRKKEIESLSTWSEHYQVSWSGSKTVMFLAFFCALVFFLSEKEHGGLVKASLFLIVLGLGFSAITLMMFIGASLGRLWSK